MNNKDFFKKQLKLIEIEVFSYCDRRCWFCPNSVIDRHSENIPMDEEQYLHILSQLKEIGYDKEVTYSRYNEPLSNKEIILKRISQAREYLPNAKLRTNTNGNFITKQYIYDLQKAGLDELFIQQYLGNNHKYNHKKTKEIMLKKLERWGFDYYLISDIEDQRIEYGLKVPGMTVHIRARNFAVEGTSRTDKVAKFNEEYVRTAPCYQPTNNMYIDYDGSIMVCCNTRSDIPEHENGKMGHVSEGYLWDIYIREKYKKWRDHTLTDLPKSGICAGCKNDLKF